MFGFTSVPYGLPLREIPVALKEISRVLVKRGKCYLWPMVCGDMNQGLSLDMVRRLVKDHRSKLPKQERGSYEAFGLEVPRNNHTFDMNCLIKSTFPNTNQELLVLTKKT